MVNSASVERAACTSLCGWLVLLISLLGWGAPTLAQDEDPPEPRPNELPAPPDVLKDGTFDLTTRVYLLDKRNRPVFVPTTYEQYLDKDIAARRAEGGDAPSTRSMSFWCRPCGGKVAEVEARVKITLNELSRKNTDIPLRLQNCLLTEKVAFEGVGTSQIQVGATLSGLHLEFASRNQHDAFGQTGRPKRYPIDGDRHTLPSLCRPALCTVQVMLPANIQDIMVRGPGGELTNDEPIEGGRRLTIKSQGGDLSISWRTGSDSKSAVGAAEAKSSTTLRIDDPREAWLAESLITVTAADSPIETLVVELPEGSERLASDKKRPEQFAIPEQYTIIVDEKNPRRLTIRAAAARENLAGLEIEIRYRWQPPAKPDETSWNNLAVPNILIRGVDRHEGNLTMSVPASQVLDLKIPPGVVLTRVTELQESVQYVFRFVRQH